MTGTEVCDNAGGFTDNAASFWMSQDGAHAQAETMHEASQEDDVGKGWIALCFIAGIHHIAGIVAY